MPRATFHPVFTLALAATRNLRWYFVPPILVFQFIGSYVGTLLAALSDWDLLHASTVDRAAMSFISGMGADREARFQVLPEFVPDTLLGECEIFSGATIRSDSGFTSSARNLHPLALPLPFDQQGCHLVSTVLDLVDSPPLIPFPHSALAVFGISAAFASDGWTISPMRDLGARLVCTTVSSNASCWSATATLNSVLTPLLGVSLSSAFLLKEVADSELSS